MLFRSISLMTTCYQTFSDDWLIEHLAFLESSVIEYYANLNFIIGDVYPRIVLLLNEISSPEKLELEHANLLLSIQTMKRRQRSDVEKKRNVRTKAAPTSMKLASFNAAMAIPRKATAQQPSRNISTHVDVFEGLDKGMKSPFPQAQKTSGSGGKPSTPTHNTPASTFSPFPPSSVPQIIEYPAVEPPIRPSTSLPVVTSTAPPTEEKVSASSKYRDLDRKSVV